MRAEALLPFGDLARERRFLGHAFLDRAPFLGAEHTKDVFGREHAAFVLRCDMVDVVAHASRQVLSFNSPRRIQLFIVPSGTLMRSASCS